MQENQTAEAPTTVVQKVADEVCEREFARMCVARRIATDVAAMPPLAKLRFQALKERLLEPMRRGELVIDAEGSPVFTPPVPPAKPIKFNRAKGSTLAAGDGFGENHDITRLLAIAAEITKCGVDTLSALDLEDFRVVSHICNFLVNR